MFILITRHQELIKALMQQEEYKPASFFSELLSVSNKTIYGDVKEIEGIIKQFGAELICIPRTGILLIADQDQRKKIHDYILNDHQNISMSVEYRRIQIVKKLLVNSEVVTLEELSSEFIISKTSLYKDLDFIKNLFESDEIQTVQDTQGIRVEGSELLIQTAIKHFITMYSLQKIEGVSNYEDLLSLLFDELIINQTKQILFEEYSDLMDQVSEYYVRSLYISMVIFFSRVYQKHHMEEDNEFLFNNIRYMETYIITNAICEELKVRINIQFSFEDIEYLCRLLFAHRITSCIKESDKQYSEIVDKLISRMEFIEKVDLSSDNRLRSSLLSHLPAMVLRLKKGIQINNPLLKEIKTQYSKLFSEVWYALSIFEMEYGIILTDDEVSLVLIYFQIALDKVSKSNNIIIICPYGTSSSQLILSRVKQFLPERDTIEVSTFPKVLKNKLNNVDLIITPIDIEVENIPCVKVSPLVNNDDLVQIMNAYTSFVIHKETKRSWSERLQNYHAETLYQYISNDKIKLEMELETKEECLDIMISDLEESGFVSEEFRQSIYNREKMGTTSLESGVALPHADPNTIIKPSVSIMTLKRAVRWGDIMVKMIVMIAFSQNEIDQFKDGITEIYQLIEKKEYVDEIVQINDVEEFKNILK